MSTSVSELTNFGSNSATTADWLAASKNMNLTACDPRAALSVPVKNVLRASDIETSVKAQERVDRRSK